MPNKGNQSGPVRVRHVDPKTLAPTGKRAASSVSRGTASRSGARKKKQLPPEVFEVDGIEVRLSHKSVKNLNLRISRDGDHVEVSAPKWMRREEVADFVLRKQDWIRTQMARISETPMAQASAASPAQVAQWKAVVQACVPALIAAWEPIMGVKAGKLAYRNMTSRWGSCQPSTGRICINVRLALYPPECLEYVVVHELCHLLERGHGPKFHQLMDAFMPDWKQRRAKLR